MDAEDEKLRAELEAARDKVRDEVDRLLGAGAHGDQNALSELEKELDQLEEALANLDGA